MDFHKIQCSIEFLLYKGGLGTFVANHIYYDDRQWYIWTMSTTFSKLWPFLAVHCELKIIETVSALVHMWHSSIISFIFQAWAASAWCSFWGMDFIGSTNWSWHESIAQLPRWTKILWSVCQDWTIFKTYSKKVFQGVHSKSPGAQDSIFSQKSNSINGSSPRICQLHR